MAPKISIVAPVFNESESLDAFISELMECLSEVDFEYEIILVDDGSKDGSSKIIEEAANKYSEITGICFKRNFGQTAAMLAGFDNAKGEYFVPIDSDLQNDPRDIVKLLAKAEEGFDIVSGWRKNRKDKFLRSFCSRVANRMLSRFLNVNLHDYGCSLKIYHRSVLEDVRLYGEMHRFIPAIASVNGASIAEIVVNHRKRQYGKSKYNLSRIVKVFLDLIAMKFLTIYIQRPTRVFGRFSLWCAMLATIFAIKVTIDKIFFGQNITGTPYFLCGLFLYMAALQLISLGLMCEVQVRTYFESQDKKIYKISKIIENKNSQVKSD